MIVHNNLTFQELISPNNKDLNFKLNTKRQIGIWGQRHAKYLRNEHHEVYLDLLCSTKIGDYLEQVDALATKLFDEEFKKLKKKYGVTKTLKSRNYFEWKARTKQAFDEANEIIFAQIIEKIDLIK